MFSSYKVLPMTADGDLYALYDVAGDQVAMGSYEVCQTLLHLVTTSPLMERPSRYYQKVAPRQRVRAVAAAAGGAAELSAVGKADANSSDAPRPGEAADSVRIATPVGKPAAARRSFMSEDAQGDVLDLLPSDSGAWSDYPSDGLLDLPGRREHDAPAPRARMSRPGAGRRPAGRSEAAGGGGVRRVAAEPGPTPESPAARDPKRGVESEAVPYGILGGTYLSSPSVSSYGYVGLFVVLVISTALLMWLLFLSL
jgi:hypothetical protein